GRLAAARRSVERDWSCHNLEVPVSSLSQGESFTWFAGHLLANAPRFHSLYNELVRQYRRQHGIRNRHHPVPDLGQEGDWLEMPFWTWTSGASRRERLFVRGRALEVRSQCLALAARDAESLVKEMRGLEARGCKLRRRALT